MSTLIDSGYIFFTLYTENTRLRLVLTLEEFAAQSEHITLEESYAFTTYPYADGCSFHGWEGVAP